MENMFWTVKDDEGIIRPLAIITPAKTDDLTGKDYGLITVNDWLAKPANKDWELVKIRLEEIINQ